MFLDFFKELGYLTKHQCLTIKNMMSGVWRFSQIKFSYTGGNCVLFATAHGYDDEKEAKEAFLYDLINKGIGGCFKADFLNRLCLEHHRNKNALVCKQGVYEFSPEGDCYFYYDDADKALQLCEGTKMSSLPDGAPMAYVPYELFVSVLSPNAKKEGLEVVVLEP